MKIKPNSLTFLVSLLCISAISLIYVLSSSNSSPSSFVSKISPRTQLASLDDASSGLVGWWKFDEGSGTTAGDSSGSGNTGTLVNGPAWTTDSKVGSEALQFDGVDDYVQANASNSLNNLSAISVSFWMNAKNIPATGAILVNKSNYLLNGWGFWAYPSGSSGYFKFGVDYDGSSDLIRYSNTSSPKISLNSWDYWTVTWDGSSSYANIHIYKNGVDVSDTSANNKNGVGNRVSDSSNNILMGSMGTNKKLTGSIDDVRIYNRALSAGEVSQLYALGGGTPSPINGSCGPAAKQYASADSFPSGTPCSLGTASPSSPSDPAPGINTSWSCNGSNGGSSAQCTASRSTQAQVDNTPPGISNIQSTAITQTGAIITWKTDESSDSQVEYGLTTSYGSQTTLNSSLTTSHSQTLSGLSVNTLYHYRVKSKDASGNLANSTDNDKSFTTSAAIIGIVPTTGNITYYVSTTGDDTNLGTQASPLRTIQKCADVSRAGNTCLVMAGTYPEHVTTKNHGTADAHITFRAQGTVTMKGFDILHRYIRVEGFDITKYVGGMAYIYVTGSIYNNTDGSYCEIVGNTIRDAVYIVADDLVFHSNGPTGGTVTSAKGGFIAAGFQPGTNVFVGSPDAKPVVNGGRSIAIKNVPGAVTDNTITFADNVSVTNEGPVYSVLNSGRSESGILIMFQGTYNPTNCLVQGNKIYNLGWAAIGVQGSNHIIENNDISHMNSHDAFNIFGHDQIIRNNYYHDSPMLDGDNDHPDFFQSWGMTDTMSRGMYNILFENNVVRNVTAQVTQLTQLPPSGGYSLDNQLGQDFIASRKFGVIFKGNVINTEAPLLASIDFPNVQWINNTFYQTPSAGPNVLQFATVPADHGNGDGGIIKNNVFLDTGNYPGYYGCVNCTFAYTDYDYVAGKPSLGYPKLDTRNIHFTETHGINGGDPKLTNIDDTTIAYDSSGNPYMPGLKPLSTSPLCGHGEGGTDIGAYTCAGNTQATTYTLTVNKSGAGTGTVTGSGINCGSSCSGTYSSGASVTLTATPASGQNFASWTGCTPVTGNPTQCTTTMNGNTTVTAAFSSVNDLVMHLDFANDWSSSRTVSDTSGTGNNATCQTSFYPNNDMTRPVINANQCPVKVSGPLSNSAGSFTGSVCQLDGKYLAVPRNNSLNSLSRGTMSVWINYNPSTDPAFTVPVTTFSYERILDTISPTQNTWVLSRFFSQGTSLVVADPNLGSSLVHDSGKKATVITFPDADSWGRNGVNNAWHLYTITWDGTNFKGYYDGNLFQSNSQTGFSSLDFGTYLAIGALNYGAPQNTLTSDCTAYYSAAVATYGYPANQQYVMPNAGFLVGKLADVRIYNRALSASEVSTLYGDGTIPSPDTTPPIVSITTPSSGATISGTSVALGANASDPSSPSGQATSGIATVTFKLDGTSIINGGLTTAPYTGTWDTTGVSNGTHTLTAVATDVAGNTTTSVPITVTVNNTTIAVDSDQDGIPDSTDRCPSTPHGVTVNTRGCSLPRATKFSTTNLSNTDLNNVQDLTVENTLGKITFDHAVTGYSLITGGDTPLDLDANVNITKTSISLDSDAMLQFKSRPATLTFKNVNISNASLTVIKADNGPCNGCTFISYNKPVLIFKVPHFTSFSVLEDAISPTLPIITAVATSSVTVSSATITWTTDIASNSVVDYGTTVSYVSEASSTNAVTSHSVNLTALTPNTLYHFTVRSTDASGNTGTTGDYTFTTTANPVIDLCPNIDGVQASIPGGMIMSGGNCITPTTGGGGGSTFYGSTGTFTPTVTQLSTQPTNCPKGSVCSPNATITPPGSSITSQLTLNFKGTQVTRLKWLLSNGTQSTFTTDVLDQTTLSALQSFQCKTLSVCSGGPYTTGYGGTGPRTRAALATLTIKLQGTQAVQSISTPITQATLNTSYTFTRILKLDSTGSDVKALQAFLNTHGFIVSSTGNGSPGHESTYFGPATAAAVSRFQMAHALQILTPNGLTQGTGNFGVSTMKVVNGMEGM